MCRWVRSGVLCKQIGDMIWLSHLCWVIKYHHIYTMGYKCAYIRWSHLFFLSFLSYICIMVAITFLVFITHLPSGGFYLLIRKGLSFHCNQIDYTNVCCSSYISKRAWSIIWTTLIFSNKRIMIQNLVRSLYNIKQ